MKTRRLLKSIICGTFFASALLLNSNVLAQTPTIGLQYNSAGASEGYTLFTPEWNTNTYLIDNCGEVVNTWTFSERPGLTAYLLEDGNVLRAGKDSLEIRDWDNNVVWSFDMGSISANQHHDIEPMPNGRILCLVWDNYPKAQAIDMGKDSTSLPGTELKLERIVELKPDAPGTAIIVWEWKAADHLVQDFDPTKLNYGVIADSPELIDINYDTYNAADPIHFNSIDYDPDLDLILLSARHLSEIFIIDHSTTTLEAASHSGGMYGKGGDLLWRWGNPQAYGAGGPSDQKLFKQHDAKWIEDGFVDEGKISVFNNDGLTGAATNSAVHVLEPNLVGGVFTSTNGMYDPQDFVWSWEGDALGETVFGGKKCGVHFLENGNALMTQTESGRMIEVNRNGDVVWVYENPHGDIIYNQGDTPMSNDFFRVHRYLPTYAGLSGATLTPNGTIEDANLVSDTCSMGLSIAEITSLDIEIAPNPASTVFNITSQFDVQYVRLYNSVGKLVSEQVGDEISVEDLETGVYLVSIQTDRGMATKRIVIE